ncbi:hypothetical protein ABG768_010066, partial [Culter alburnus]
MVEDESTEELTEEQTTAVPAVEEMTMEEPEEGGTRVEWRGKKRKGRRQGAGWNQRGQTSMV